MRYAKLAFALLGFAAVLVAAEPFTGTWKLNTEKSKYKTGAPAKEQTVTITEADSNLDVTIKGTAQDGTPISSVVLGKSIYERSTTGPPGFTIQHTQPETS